MTAPSHFQTYRGKKADVLRPTPEAVDVVDIIHSLSLLCRFNGHCRYFYSVAQHSCLVADLLVHYFNEPRYELLGLLHDATEAYVGDMIRPLKTANGMGTYRTLEMSWALAIGERLGLGEQLVELPDVVKSADAMMLHRERVDLLSSGWGRDKSLAQVDDRVPVITPLSHEAAREEFACRLMRTLPLVVVDRSLFEQTF
jgi:uncharacterized protein